MRIVSVEVEPFQFQLRHPSIVAYDALEEVENVVVRIEVEGGLVGWGNAAPDFHVTGETPEGVLRTLADHWRPLLLGADARQIQSLWHQLQAEAPGQPTALAAVDVALYDLLGKAAGLPLVQLLGHARHRIATSLTLSLEPLEQNLKRVREFCTAGARILKIKCGLDLREDVARIRAIRAAAGPSVLLTLDANQGYDVEDSLALLAAVKDCQIAFLEQPVPAADEEGLRELVARSQIPVMADESVLDAHDLLQTPAQLVNLKLMKMGGITGALQCNAVAEARGIPVMIGCMDESRISMAAATHLALALHNVAWADLDGHLDLVNDLATGAPSFSDGMLSVPSTPGLGIDVDVSRCST
jgi:L-alanine-DL-glutamate epimerase-like enolase superfamily enzyme